MKRQEVLGEKAQEKVFNRLLKKPENQECADCPTKGPRWASLEFGIFVCMNCSGAHRHMGPSVTRVKSTKLDTWVPDYIEILDNVGNKSANEYWEFSNQNQPKRLTQNSSLEERIRYIQEKYIRKRYVDPNSRNPVTVFLENKAKGIVQPQEQTENVQITQPVSQEEAKKRFFSDSEAEKELWDSFKGTQIVTAKSNSAQQNSASGNEQVQHLPRREQFSTYGGPGTINSTAAATTINLMDFDNVQWQTPAQKITKEVTQSAPKATPVNGAQTTQDLTMIDWTTPQTAPAPVAPVNNKIKPAVAYQAHSNGQTQKQNGAEAPANGHPTTQTEIDFKQLYNNGHTHPVPQKNTQQNGTHHHPNHYYAQNQYGAAQNFQKPVPAPYNAQWGQLGAVTPQQQQILQQQQVPPPQQQQVPPQQQQQPNIMALYGNSASSVQPQLQNQHQHLHQQHQHHSHPHQHHHQHLPQQQQQQQQQYTQQQQQYQQQQKTKVDQSRYDYLNQINQYQQAPPNVYAANQFQNQWQ